MLYIKELTVAFEASLDLVCVSRWTDVSDSMGIALLPCTHVCDTRLNSILAVDSPCRTLAIGFLD